MGLSNDAMNRIIIAHGVGATYLCTSAGPNAQWFSLSN